MVRELKKSEIPDFIDFGDRLYAQDANYTPYMRGDLKKTLHKLVFEDKTYRALVSLDEAGAVQGRLLLTTGKSKQLKTEHCGYFSHLEVAEDIEVFRELMCAGEECVRSMGAEYLLGSFFKHDPDNRRGILVSGYEYAPMILTSHNLPYYGAFLERAGYSKLTDALEYEIRQDPKWRAKVEKVASASLRQYEMHVSKADLKNVDREIEDIHTVMKQASTEINFEEVLPVSELKKNFGEWKRFIDPEFVFIVRKNADDSPVGFSLSIPDYNELIRKMKGRLDPKGLFAYLTQRNKLRALRGVLQYVVPEYQMKGVIPILYNETLKATDRHHIVRMTLGTIMENNHSSNSVVRSAGGELSRVYRLYYKDLRNP